MLQRLLYKLAPSERKVMADLKSKDIVRENEADALESTQSSTSTLPPGDDDRTDDIPPAALSPCYAGDVVDPPPSTSATA
ncbi:unnamed protein product [Arctia plantaginis]|uniref:Uncharacterized protein n=1 Tax=Arctia plantaginis TaxID=874455 RepID=A0A8S1AKX8_ARCPL|nr:unnamed protein product [Arctia plantaginis]